MENTYNGFAEQKDTKPPITEIVSDYVETYYKLTVLNINQKTADISAVATFSMGACLAGLLVSFFMGIAASLWLGSLLNSNALGFLLVGVFFLFLFVLLFLTRKKLFYPFIKNLVIKSIYE